MIHNDEAWFTIDRIDGRTYALSEYGQWMKVHSFLFIGRERAALIDTGLGVGNIRSVVERLTLLPVVVITTHSHWDHIGGHKSFDEILIHEAERTWLEEGFPEDVEELRRWLQRKPFTKAPPPDFRLDRFKRTICKATQVIDDGDVVDLGDRSLQILLTPGHSPGHVCVYEEETGYLAAGDLVYAGVLLAGIEDADPNDFQRSIDRIKGINGLTRLLPGHGRLDIPVDLIQEAADGFESLRSRGLLEIGSGVYRFNRIKIRV